jgi:hypothetical protein
LIVVMGRILLTLGVAGGLTIFASEDNKKVDSQCHYRALGALPDGVCTPGAINRHVTQSNIKSTICKAGWTKTIRPPAAVTHPLKIESIAKYGNAFGKDLSHYEFDHLISLELGGAPLNSKNLWPEPIKAPGGHGAYGKDVVENRLHNEVCSGQMTLKEARRIERTDWRKG